MATATAISPSFPPAGESGLRRSISALSPSPNPVDLPPTPVSKRPLQSLHVNMSDPKLSDPKLSDPKLSDKPGSSCIAQHQQQHLDDGSDGWSDARSEKSVEGSAGLAEETMETEIHSMCESKLNELVEAERLAPDFLAEAQRNGSGGVSEAGRQDLLIWLRHFNAFFGLGPDSFAVAVSLVDSMLELTRVKPEHADLVGVACLRIAAEMVGAAELQPTPRELCINCDNAFSEQELSRMETIVCNKLQGHFQKVVPFDFLPDLLQLAALSNAPPVVSSGAFEAVVSTRLLTTCFYYELMSFRPSTIALAVLMFELRRLEPDYEIDTLAHKIETVLSVPHWDLQNCLRCLARNIADSGRAD